jgi:hypothetical protein
MKKNKSDELYWSWVKKTWPNMSQKDIENSKKMQRKCKKIMDEFFVTNSLFSCEKKVTSIHNGVRIYPWVKTPCLPILDAIAAEEKLKFNYYDIIGKQEFISPDAIIYKFPGQAVVWGEMENENGLMTFRFTMKLGNVDIVKPKISRKEYMFYKKIYEK